ncbi:glycerophosphodiester phosphodiesterase [Thalassiella azotivora]
MRADGLRRRGANVPPPPVVPQVVAHRGASHDHPEHTLGAYVRAIEAGADALECDVRMTADGHLVCVHDRRVDRTSNGRGRVSALELEQLEGLDWASWKRAQGGRLPGELPDRDQGRLLTLRRLLSVVADSGRPVEVAVETKHPTRYAGHVEREVVDVLDHFGWAHPPRGRRPRARVMSFSVRAVQRVRAMAPALPLVLLTERVPVRLGEPRLPRGVATAGVSVQLLRDERWYVDRLRAAGYAVHVFTVDEPEDVQRCLDAGVEAIITNRPDAVLGQLGRGSA